MGSVCLVHTRSQRALSSRKGNPLYGQKLQLLLYENMFPNVSLKRTEDIEHAIAKIYGLFVILKPSPGNTFRI